MLRLPHFQYLAPRSLDEAASMLAEYGPQAMVVAGGTDLFPNMKRRQQEPPVVIGLRSVTALRGCRFAISARRRRCSRHREVRRRQWRSGM